jgi:hypothetical protein
VPARGLRQRQGPPRRVLDLDARELGLELRGQHPDARCLTLGGV